MGFYSVSAAYTFSYQEAQESSNSSIQKLNREEITQIIILLKKQSLNSYTNIS